MRKIAIFVDAGYVFAQGSVTLQGRQSPRSELQIDPGIVISRLNALADELSGNARLLRCYWYDGAQRGGVRSTEHDAFARMDNVKLRLGIINSRGQQKGVDSLILTDLMELARLKSIDEALLVSGDGDLRVGIQIAQNHGVRVHLLGLHPARGSQSPELMDEADTTREWDQSIVSQFLRISHIQEKIASEPQLVHAKPAVGIDPPSALQAPIESYVDTLEKSTLTGLLVSWEQSDNTIPPEIDRELLRLCYVQVGRSLDAKEKPMVRRIFRQAVKARNV